MSPARRVASLISSGTEMLFAIGAGRQVVAVSHECDYPPAALALPRVTRSRIDDSAAGGQIDAQVRSLMASGGPLYEIDGARLASLAPDVIVTQAQCDVCAVRLDDVLSLAARRPELAGAAVIPLNPLSLDDILNDLLRVGEAVGAGQGAQRAVEGLRERVAEVRRAVEGAATRRVACLEWLDPLMLAGNWMPELIESAGGRSPLSGREHSPYAGWSELAEFDPEVILLMPCGFDLARTIQEAAPLQRRPEFSKLQAARSGQVVAVDGSAYFNRSGPRIVDSLEILAHLLHPQRVPPPLSAAERSHAWRALDEA